MKVVFDIGGSHMRVAAVQGERLGEPLKIDTPQEFDKAMRALCDLIAQVVGNEEVTAIAGGSAGDFVDGRIMGGMPYLPRWVGGDMGGALCARFPAASATIINDGQAGCLGEATWGAGKGYGRVAYVCVGTGIGGAFANDGELALDDDFKVGKQVMDDEGHTLEQLAGGVGVKEHYGHRWEDLSPSEYAEVLGVLAKGLEEVAKHWQSDVMVLRGAVPFVRPDFLDELKKRLSVPTPAVLAALGQRSVLMGALTLLR